MKKENLNKSITSNETEPLTENLPKEKNLGPYGFIGKLYTTFKEFIPILFKSSKKTGEQGTLLN